MGFFRGRASMARYSIVSIDNGNIGASGARTNRGDFDCAEAALRQAKKLVDGALLEHFESVTSAHELMNRYMRDGSEVPLIYGEPRVAFHAYQYAREKANALFADSVD
jgi:hypothetical protein